MHRRRRRDPARPAGKSCIIGEYGAGKIHDPSEVLNIPEAEDRLAAELAYKKIILFKVPGYPHILPRMVQNGAEWCKETQDVVVVHD